MTTRYSNTYYPPATEVHTPHTWRCCWKRNLTNYAIFIGITLMWLAILAVAFS